MALRIEDYAIIGDTRSAALVGRNGAIDWLCAPRFDSPALFAALLGTEANGHWTIAPLGEVRRVERRYRTGTAILETDLETDEGAIRLVDCMPMREGHTGLVRVVEGLRGRVPMQMRLAPRFDYGRLIPCLGRIDHGVFAFAGPDAVCLRTPADVRIDQATASATFTVSGGERIPFQLDWYLSHLPCPAPGDPVEMIESAEAWWKAWAGRCQYDGPHADDVLRSLVTLKTLTYSPTGAIVAALTTSLPEEIGGVRNWDYRYCWLRDGAFALAPLIRAGYLDEAVAWREWLLRAIAGDPGQLQLMYGIGGEHRLTEIELPWLSGYEGSKPVRTGNGAWSQFQLDIFGEVFAVLYRAWQNGLPERRGPGSAPGIDLETVIEVVERRWREPDEGIWEIRGQRQHFTYSKVAAWTAVDRAIRLAEAAGRPAPLDRWRAVRDEIHAEVCAQGFDRARGTFVQYYGGTGLDASLLLIPISGFLPADDPRVLGTIDAIQRELCSGPFVWRYSTEAGIDGLAGGEGAFLICSFWLVSALAMAGRIEEAERHLEDLRALQNDVGLLSEEYDPAGRRLLGNFPQAFSHIGLLHAIFTIAEARAAR